MSAKTLLFALAAALLLLAGAPSDLGAKDKPSAEESSSKRKRKSKKTSKPDARIEEDPYGKEEESAEAGQEADAQPAEGDEELSEADKPVEGAAAEGSLRRSNRMEFDERLVKGQAAKSGAVYLFKRTPRRLPGLVPMRRSYRSRIVKPILGERELMPVSSHTQDKAKPKKKVEKKEPVKPPVEQESTAEPQGQQEQKELEKQEEPTKKRTRKKRDRKKRDRGGDK